MTDFPPCPQCGKYRHEFPVKVAYDWAVSKLPSCPRCMAKAHKPVTPVTQKPKCPGCGKHKTLTGGICEACSAEGLEVMPLPFGEQL